MLVRRSAWSLALAAFVLNFYFYPRLLPYQSSSALAARMEEQGLDPANLACYKRHGHALDFYTGVRAPRPETPEAVQSLANAQAELYLYTTLEGKTELDEAGLRYDTVLAFHHFQVALLNAQFLNPSTRKAALTPVFLLKIKPADFDQNL